MCLLTLIQLFPIGMQRCVVLLIRIKRITTFIDLHQHNGDNII